MKKLSEEQIVKSACASVILEGLPLPENFESKLSDYNNGIISEEELMKDEN